MKRVLEGRYGPTMATALLALTPYIVANSASELFREEVMAGARLTPAAFQQISALATAGYAFGALLGGDLINRIRQRRLFLACNALLGAAWVMAALARSPALYGAGQVLAGVATGLLLVAALPPLMRRFPVERAPLTAAIVNIGLFGAVAAGPLTGGVVSALHAWRGLDAAFAALAAATFALALVTLPDPPPTNPRLPLDVPALGLGLGATVLPFWAAGALGDKGFGSPWVLGGLGAGLLCLIALLLVEYHQKEPLAPVKPMWSTLPAAGTLIATFGGGVFVSLTRLMLEEMRQARHAAPLQIGLGSWPQIVGAAAAAALLGLLFRTRFIPLLVMAGMLLLVGAAAILSAPSAFETREPLIVASALLGLGAGATVSPGLFLAGLSLPAQILGRIVALIELVRSLGDFILAPVAARIARDASGGGLVNIMGADQAIRVTLWIAVGSGLAGAGLWLLGGAPLPRPDLEGWLKADRPALQSPPLLFALRRRAARSAQAATADRN